MNSLIYSGSLSWKVTTLLGVKFEKTLNKILVNILICWWTSLLRNRWSQFVICQYKSLCNWFCISLFIIPDKSFTGGGYLIVRLYLQYVFDGDKWNVRRINITVSHQVWLVCENKVNTRWQIWQKMCWVKY